MPLLDVTDELVRNIVEEVEPLVRRLTGWDLQIGGLSERIVTKDVGYREIILARLKGAGVTVADQGSRTTIDRLMEYAVSETMLGAYEPSTQEMVVVRDNVDESNLDGLRLIIAHELVHRGQHVNHGDLMARVDQWMRQAYVDLDGAVTPDIQAADELQEVMTVLESHASYVEHTIHRIYLPGAHIEAKFDVAVLLMRVLGTAKVAQYVDAVPAVAAATSEGRLRELYSRL